MKSNYEKSEINRVIGDITREVESWYTTPEKMVTGLIDELFLSDALDVAPVPNTDDRSRVLERRIIASAAAHSIFNLWKRFQNNDDTLTASETAIAAHVEDLISVRQQNQIDDLVYDETGVSL